jgi:hypothetical protein
MHELHRYRSDRLSIAEVSHFFVQAIEDAVDGPRKERREIAALVFRIELSLLDALSDLGQQINLRTASAAEQTQYSSAVKRFLHALLPEIVRQIARIEGGQEANCLLKNPLPFGSPLPPTCSVRRGAELKGERLDFECCPR